MSIHDIITNKEDFIKIQEHKIDKEIVNLTKFAKYKLREVIEAGTFDPYEWMWDRNNLMAASVLLYVVANDQIPVGMGKDFKMLCKLVKETHFHKK